MKKIRVIIKEPGKKPYSTTIRADLRSIKRKFGRDFKALRYMEDVSILIPKDNSGLDYNCEYCGRDFWGPMIFCGYSEKELLPYPDEFRVFRALNPSLFKDFEKDEAKKLSRLVDLIFIILSFVFWGWIGFELLRQIIELL